MKKYAIEKYRKGRATVIEGTLDELTQYFSYTLLCGNSWNRKINRNPKSGAALVKALNQSVDETQGGCYDRDSYKLVG